MFDYKNKKKLAAAVGIYFAIILFLIFISKMETILSVINTFLSVLSPIIIGFAIAYLLNPILTFYEAKVLKRIKSKYVLRGLSVTLTYISLFLFLTVFVLLIVPQLIESIIGLADKFDSYKDTVLNMANSFISWLNAKGLPLDGINAEHIITLIDTNMTSSGGILKTIISFLADNMMNLLEIPKNILLAFFISIYVLISKERLGAQITKGARALLSEKTFATLSHRVKFTHDTFGGYFTGVIIDAIFVGVLTFIWMLIFNIPYASLVAVVIAITNIIPIFGPFIGAIPSALLIFIDDPKKAIIFVVMILITQQIDGNIIAPRILGNSTGLSSLGVIVAITVMGYCFGFVGMVAGVPVFAVLVALMREIVEEHLTAKGLATETAEYYPRNSFIKPRKKEERNSLTDKLRRKKAKQNPDNHAQ